MHDQNSFDSANIENISNNYRYYPSPHPHINQITFVTLKSIREDEQSIGYPCYLSEYNNIPAVIYYDNKNIKKNLKKVYLANFKVIDVKHNIYELSFNSLEKYNKKEYKKLYDNFLGCKVATNLIMSYCRKNNLNINKFYEENVFNKEIIEKLDISGEFDKLNIFQILDNLKNNESIKNYDSLNNFILFYKEKTRTNTKINFDIIIKETINVARINEILKNIVRQIYNKYKTIDLELYYKGAPNYNFVVLTKDYSENEVINTGNRIVEELNEDNNLNIILKVN